MGGERSKRAKRVFDLFMAVGRKAVIGFSALGG
jgi:hypothetical protein